ncbi:hypothetical protein SeMB42_g02864 [Synchytrium endobioticum]|uniref:Uncharacterized protein n=1 Tax=Synchytrium endobioticum TaxID=286115 RepID=A0A507D4J9_9FUNG|nr:hypothetical protein SeLEV6574_g03325 [Synchytrium endobioticum]TPX48786.1 hypothetical protein SeMB42_g02864 [Synchytrium endobioticum]
MGASRVLKIIIMFFDLDVPYPANDREGGTSASSSLGAAHNVAQSARKLGYHGIAYNVVMPLKTALNKPCDIKIIDTASSLVALTTHLKSSTPSQFHQLTRLTVIADESAINIHLTSNNQNLLSYDLISVIPTTEKMLSHACSNYECDIISLDMSVRMPFYLKPSTLNMAVQRGVFFEIGYGSAVRDTTARRNLIGNAANLIRATRGQNIIVSSNAACAMDLRAPYDVINLCTLFGLDGAAGKRAISAHPRAVVYHAATRRQTFKGFAAVEAGVALARNEEWVVGCLDVADGTQKRGQDADEEMEG